MANNGYLINGSCSSDLRYLSFSLCPSGTVYTSIFANSSRLNDINCYNSSWIINTAGPKPQIPSFSCEIPGPPPPSTIPTVADGITLGWQAGAALILVGCILFLKKALK